MPVSDSVCLMPWIHAHVDAQGVRGLCAIDQGRFGDDEHRQGVPLEEYWNGEEMRSVRRQMLAGKLPDRCRLCKGDSNRAVTLKDEVNARWKEWVPIVIRETDKDGATTLSPFSFDYRNSVCNLKCRICGPRSSSALEGEARSIAAIGTIESHVADWDQTYRGRRDQALQASRLELLDACRRKAIKHLYWAGGEPLFDGTHWDVMSALAESGQAGEIDVVYNTNLTMLSFKGRSVETLWPLFRSVHVQASVDGLGASGEFIRKGFQTKTFTNHVETLQLLALIHPSIRLTLDATLTSLGLLYLGDLLEFAVMRRIVLTAKLMKPREENYYMAVEALPAAVSKDWAGRWMTWIAAHDRDNLLGSAYDTLLHQQRQQRHPDPRLLRKSAKSLVTFDRERRETGKFKELCLIDDRLANFPV